MIAHEDTVRAWKAHREAEIEHEQKVKNWNEGRREEYERLRNSESKWEVAAFILFAVPALSAMIFFLLGLFIPGVCWFILAVVGCALTLPKAMSTGEAAGNFEEAHRPGYLSCSTIRDEQIDFAKACMKEIKEMGLNISGRDVENLAFQTDRGLVTIALEPNEPDDPKFLLDGKIIAVSYRQDRQQMMDAKGAVLYVDKEAVII